MVMMTESSITQLISSISVEINIILFTV